MNLVGVTKAAKALGITHSSLSRYLDKYPGLDRSPKGASRRKVDLNELRLHRGENINLEPDAQASLPAVGDSGEKKETAEPEAVAHRARSSLAKADYDETRAEIARLELQKLRGELISLEEVEAAFSDAGALLQNRLESRRRDLADQFAALKDPREIEAAMKKSDIEMLTAFAQRLGKLADDADDPDTGSENDVEAA